jgi:hypothetical protein
MHGAVGKTCSSIEHIFPPARLLTKTMKNIPYKTASTNGLPDDEHVMFETCSRHEELN